MKYKAGITVAIVTKDRPDDLKKCLKSIITQTLPPNAILLVDNSTGKSAYPIYLRLKKKLPLHYAHEPDPCIPRARNLALDLSPTRYLAFVDDDCVLTPAWVKNGFEAIKKSRRAFVLGRTLPLLPLNIFSRYLFNDYLNWFNTGISSPRLHFLNSILDTKNIILDLSRIKKIRFDTGFSIFEDIDFGLQLKKNKLFGHYSDNMVLHHQENLSLIKTIKKTILRGRYKKLITAKWGNFDNYKPLKLNLLTLRLFINSPISFIFQLLFSLGFYSQTAPKIIIVNSKDSGANEVRARQLLNLLSPCYHVQFLDSQSLFDREAFGLNGLFRYHIYSLYFRFFQLLKDRLHLHFPAPYYYSYLLLRSCIVALKLQQMRTTLAIIQYPEDMAAAISKNYKTIYDSPTILADELSSGPRYSAGLRRLEAKVFQTADCVSFHWYTYFDLLHQNHIFPKKEIHLNWAGHPSAKTSKHKTPPKIVYLGILNSPWVNPELLIRLSSLYPIDIYSYQTPDPELYPPGSINYCGYLKDLRQLSNYQFGLITLSKDNFRSRGFSAKHIDYLNHGLPTLCPEWRSDRLLRPTVIPYNEHNFLSQIKKFSSPGLWQKLSRKSYKMAQKLSWQTHPLPSLQILAKLISP